MSLFPPPDLKNLGDMAAEGIMYAAVADLGDQVATLIYDVTSKTSKFVAAFAQAAELGVEGIKPGMAEIHQRLAALAKAGIVTAYTSSLKGTPTYRTGAELGDNRRYAGDMLLNAIQDPEFCYGDENGIYIANTKILDAKARQWRRLNYGAGGAAGGGAEMYTVNWSDLDAFVLAEPGSKRPGFSLPAGRWIGDEFYPASELEGDTGPVSVGQHHSLRGTGRNSTAVQTKGIQGKHWIGAGLKIIAEQLAPEYDALFRKLWDAADEAGREALAGDTGLTNPNRSRPKSGVT
jgi:hypothetical protein